MSHLKQLGFSLFEVLIAVLIASLAVTAVMSIHVAHLRKIVDHTTLSRAQLILDNAVYRVQQRVDANRPTPLTTPELIQITSSLQTQIIEAGLKSAHLNIIPKNNGWLVQIDWQAHDEKDPIQRVDCTAVSINHHCLASWVAP